MNKDNLTNNAIYDQLKKRLVYIKATPEYAHNQLYEVHGAIKMAYNLGALTKEQMLELEHECVADGINNPKYF